MGQLSALRVKTEKGKGLHADGDGLYLQVGPSGAKSWVFRYRLKGRRRLMGLGSLKTVSLADAREAAGEARKLVRRGVDPIQAKEAAKEAERQETGAKTFRDAAGEYLKINEPAWQNTKHRQQWRNTLEAYAYPKLGKTAVRDVESVAIASVLQPLYLTKRETAKRVRGRIEAVLAYAIAKGYRSGPNPALWRGVIQNLVNRQPRVPKQHFRALPYDDMPDFMAALRGQDGIAARALEFTILTAARTGETVNAMWPEFDLDEALWTVPAERMKMRREHRVPLSPAAVQTLKAMKPSKGAERYVFPGSGDGEPLSNMAMLMVVRRMDYRVTVHGFRSSFRDWAADKTHYPREVAEAALAHTVKDQSEASYRRSDLFAKRQSMMADWAIYCGMDRQPGGVVALKSKARRRG